MEEDLRTTIMTEFEPKKDTNNVSGRLRSFINSVLKGGKGNGGKGNSGKGTRHTSTPAEEAVAAFCQKWGLDKSHEEWLWGLPEGNLQTILEEFEPRSDTRDVVAKLKGFAKTLNGPSSRGALQRFQTQWQLDDRCMQLILSMPPAVQARVMADFDPRGDTRDISGKCLCFARTVLQAHQREQQGRYATPMTASVCQPQFYSRSSGGKGGRPAGQTLIMGVIDHFLQSWGLTGDRNATALLLELPASIRNRVMTEFEPRGDTKDIFGKLKKFSESVAMAAGAQERHGSRYGTENGSRNAGATTSKLVGSKRHHSDYVTDFCSKWGLNGEAEDFMRGLHPDAQHILFAEFAPRGDTKDISNKFMVFARSVSAGAGRKAKAKKS